MSSAAFVETNLLISKSWLWLLGLFPLWGLWRCWFLGTWKTPLYWLVVDIQGVVGSYKNHHLYWILCIELQFVLSTPWNKTGHFYPTGRIIDGAHEVYYGCVICRFHQLDGRVAGCAFIGVQGLQERWEHTALWSLNADGSDWKGPSTHKLPSIY